MKEIHDNVQLYKCNRTGVTVLDRPHSMLTCKCGKTVSASMRFNCKYCGGHLQIPVYIDISYKEVE